MIRSGHAIGPGGIAAPEDLAMLDRLGVEAARRDGVATAEFAVHRARDADA